MTVTTSHPQISSEDHLPEERGSLFKSEYRQGKTYDTPEISDNHDTICVNLVTFFKNQLRGSGCYIHTGKMKVIIEPINGFHHPDLLVTRDDRDRTCEYFKRYPCLIVEVMSALTEAFDRGEKFADYRKLETLQEYVLISQERISVECFRRNAEGAWGFYSYGEGEEVYFASIDLRLPISVIYEDLLRHPHQRNFEPKMPVQHYTKFPSTPSTLGLDSQVPSQIATKIQVSPSLNSQLTLKSLGSVALLTAAAVGGTQVYSYWQHQSLISDHSFSANMQAGLIASPAPSVQPNPVNALNEKPLNEPNYLLEMKQLGALEAKDILRLINRTQKGFYWENGRFAATWQDLGFKINSNDGSYEYAIAQSDRMKMIVTAGAKKLGLKSYVSAVIVEGEEAINTICETNQPSDKPPESPTVVGKNFQCAAGSSRIAEQS